MTQTTTGPRAALAKLVTPVECPPYMVDARQVLTAALPALQAYYAERLSEAPEFSPHHQKLREQAKYLSGYVTGLQPAECDESLRLNDPTVALALYQLRWERAMRTRELKASERKLAALGKRSYQRKIEESRQGTLRYYLNTTGALTERFNLWREEQRRAALSHSEVIPLPAKPAVAAAPTSALRTLPRALR